MLCAQQCDAASRSSSPNADLSANNAPHLPRGNTGENAAAAATTAHNEKVYSMAAAAAAPAPSSDSGLAVPLLAVLAVLFLIVILMQGARLHTLQQAAGERRGAGKRSNQGKKYARVAKECAGGPIPARLLAASHHALLSPADTYSLSYFLLTQDTDTCILTDTTT